MDKKLKEFWAGTLMELGGHTLFQPRIHGDVPSFMHVPTAMKSSELEGMDAAFLGIPWQGIVGLATGHMASFGAKGVHPEMTDERAGTDEAPDHIRKYSQQYSIPVTQGYLPEVAPDFKLADHLKLADYGDVEIKEWNIEETAERAIAKVGDIVRAGAVPMVFGGDHSIPYPVVRGISDNTKGKMGLIWFDRHYDNAYGGDLPYPYTEMSRLNVGNAMFKILETCQVDPANVVVIGIGGMDANVPVMPKIMEEAGIKVFTITDVEKQGISEVVHQALEISGKGTEQTYVTLDADVMDPLTFPAMRWAEPFGISARKIREALAIISQNTKLAGFDICCVSPAYDNQGIGGLTAARFFIELLKGMAIQKMK